MNPFVLIIISEFLLVSTSLMNSESQTLLMKMADSFNKAKSYSPNLINDRIIKNKNDKEILKTINHKTENDNNSRTNSTITKSPSTENKYRNSMTFIPINEADQNIIKLVNRSPKTFNSKRNKNSLFDINIPLVYRLPSSALPRLKSSEDSKSNKNSQNGKNYKTKDLVFRAYIKEERNSKSVSKESSSKQITNVNPKNMKNENQGNLLQRIFKTTKQYLCLFPFVTCIQSLSYQDKSEAYELSERTTEESSVEKDEPSVIVQEECPQGKYVPDLDLCLFFVFRESKFREAKSTCKSLSDEGKLWVTDMDASSASSILKENKVVKGDYSAWIDGVFFEDTLAGTGHFDSQYKIWLNLGTVRGRRKSGDKVVINNKGGDIFYSYDEGRKLHPFICQSPPHNSEQLVWNNRYSFSDYSY